MLGGVTVMKGSEKHELQKGEHQLEQVKWVYHDGIGYVFPEPAKVNISNRVATGSWFLINRQSDTPKDEVRGEVFKLWLDHGKRPQEATYQYIVLPAVAEKDLPAIANSKTIEIIANTPHVQAVKYIGLNICEVIFHKAGEVQISNDSKIGIDSPGLVMIKQEGNTIKQISVADPSRKLGKMHLTITGRIERSGDTFKSVWNGEKGISEIAIDLPQSVYAGKSVTIEL